MRFLMLNWRDPFSPISGGAERVTQAYLAELVRRGHEVTWFTFAHPTLGPTDEVEGIKILRAGGMGTAAWAARKWFRDQPRFDLVIDQHHGIPWYAPWWCGTNCIAYIHEVLGPIWNSFYPWPLSAVGRCQEKWTHWFYRDVPFFTASSATREKLLSHGVRQVKIIPYGVHTKVLPALDEKALTAHPLELVMVSRLAPNKRIAHGIRTLRELRQRNVDAHLTIVGTGEEAELLRQLAGQLGIAGHVKFAGALTETEKDALLRRSHFLLHTSQREGWGLNVIEANAMGTPAAVYPAEGLIESTLDNETGIVAAAETPESLASRIQEALGQPARYQQWRHAAWLRADSFHWRNVLPIAAAWLEEQASQPHPKTKKAGR